MIERHHDGAEHRHGGRKIAHARHRAGGRGAYGPHAIHEPGTRPPRVEIEARLARLRPHLAVGGERGEDETRVLGADVLPGELEPGQPLRHEVGDEDVGAPHEGEQDVTPLAGGQVEGNAALVPRGEEPRVLDVAPGNAGEVLELAVRVPALGRLDLDDVGAEIGHDGGRRRPRQPGADVEDLEAAEDGHDQRASRALGARAARTRGSTSRATRAV